MARLLLGNLNNSPKTHVSVSLPLSYFLKYKYNYYISRPAYDIDTIAMFTRTIKEIQSATESALNRSVEYRSVTAPAHFGMKSSMPTLRLAAYNLHFFASEKSYQVMPLPNAARLAYGLDSCKGFEQPPDCNLDDEDYFVLVLEYSQNYLVLTFLSIAQYVCNPIETKILAQNGEEVNKGVRSYLALENTGM